MDLWKRTRSTFVDRLQSELTRLDMLPRDSKKPVGKLNGDWMSVRCPLCTDSGGSAGISIHSGHLRCLQCGANDSLFEWIQKKYGYATAWEACKHLAQEQGLDLPTRSRRATLTKITAATIDQLVSDLWEIPEAEYFREQLKKRGFTQEMLAPYHIGFDGKGIVFPRIDPTGEVSPRAHRWLCRRNPKWSWTAKTVEQELANYYWPAHILPKEGDEIWLVEGETDCLTVREKLKPEGVACYTWTGGVATCPQPIQIPDWLRDRKVVLVADNDTWQGMKDIWAPDDRKESEARMRKRKFLTTAAVWGRFCDIRLGAVPISPEEKWGGDIDDWYKAGGRDLGDFELTLLKDALDPPMDYMDVLACQVGSNPGKLVRFTGEVAGIDVHKESWCPESTNVDCQLGAFKTCSRCRMPSEFPEGIINWKRDPELQSMLAKCLASPDCNKMIEKYVVGRPPGCPYINISHSTDGRNTYVWHCTGEGVTPGNEIKVLSKQPPVAHEPMQISGHVLLEIQNPWIFVSSTKVRALQTQKVKIEPFLKDLSRITPWKSNDVEEIRKYLEERWWDLCANVTRISNPRLTMVYDLVAHSARRYHLFGKSMRAWLDACIVGVTRCGKTETAACLHKHFGEAGERASTQSNFTQAGLVAGNVKTREGNYRIQPGAFPRNHKKMLILDEAHLMKDHRKGVNMIDQLQEIRDRGIADCMKVAGHYKLPAEVRLLMLANPLSGNLNNYQYPCEAFVDMYGNPEFIARMDFGIVVTDKEASDARATALPEIRQVWTSELCYVLRQRAWDLEEEDITIEDEAMEVAKARLDVWEELMDPKLPLFTGSDKIVSLLRVAISIANLCVSHSNDPNKCLVRSAHVQLAAQIIEETWDSTGYTLMSSQRRAGVSLPLIAEFGLSKYLPSATEAVNVLPMLFGGHIKAEYQSILGVTFAEIDRWLARMISTGAMTHQRTRAGVFFTWTDGGNELLSELLGIARDDPDEYNRRRRELNNWFNKDLFNRPSAPAPKLRHLGVIEEDDEHPF